MPIAKKAIVKKKVAKEGAAALAKHKAALKKLDEGTPIKPMWSKGRINAIVDGLMTVHYFMHSGAMAAYIKGHPWAKDANGKAIKAVTDARKVFYQALEAYQIPDDDDDDDIWDDEEEDDDDSGF